MKSPNLRKRAGGLRLTGRGGRGKEGVEESEGEKERVKHKERGEVEEQRRKKGQLEEEEETEDLRLRRRRIERGRLRGEEENNEKGDAGVWQVEEGTVTQQDVLPAASVISCELP